MWPAYVIFDVYRIAGRLLTRMPASMKRAAKHLAPMIEERLVMEDQHQSKDWPGKPVGFFVLLIEA